MRRRWGDACAVVRKLFKVSVGFVVITARCDGVGFSRGVIGTQLMHIRSRGMVPVDA